MNGVFVSPICNIGVSPKVKKPAKKIENKNLQKPGELGTSRMSSINWAAYTTTKPDLSFGRLKVDHLHNGAYVDEFKNVFFKLFTFDDVEKVFVEIQKQGEKVKNSLFELAKEETGIFKSKLTKEDVAVGDMYRFVIKRGDGTVVRVKDPYAMKRYDVIGDFSEIYSHHDFKWSKADKAWRDGKVEEKISRKAGEKGLTNLNDAVITKVNIHTLTEEGSLEAAKKYIDQVADDGIFNTIELMPLNNAHSFNWGYDNGDPFAVQMSWLGGPDKFKEFVDHAHSKKINVFMDVVPNHMSVDGFVLDKIGPYTDPNKSQPFGPVFNLEGDPAHNDKVRDYLANMCLNWLENYHCDGLRLDMTKMMESDYSIKHIAMELHHHYPNVILIAEDARNNMAKLTKPLKDFEEALGDEAAHVEMMKKVDRNEISLDNLGMDSEWDFPFFHALRESIFNINPIKNLINAIKNSMHRVKYLMSHDEIGNMDATRLISKLVCNSLDMVKNVKGDYETQRAQRAAHATQAILKSKVTGEYDNFSEPERIAFLEKHFITRDISPELAGRMLNEAISAHKHGLGVLFSSPGPKMIFQGDEQGVLNYFKFFRELSGDLVRKDFENLFAEKGYEPGLMALLDSKMNSINYAKPYLITMKKIKKYTKDISKLSKEIPALRKGKVVDKSSFAHESTRVSGIHLKYKDSETFTITNESGYTYQDNYKMNLPKGVWRQVSNSNDIKYGGDSRGTNFEPIYSDGSIEMSIPANSTIVLQKIGERILEQCA